MISTTISKKEYVDEDLFEKEFQELIDRIKGITTDLPQLKKDYIQHIITLRAKTKDASNSVCRLIFNKEELGKFFGRYYADLSKKDYITLEKNANKYQYITDLNDLDGQLKDVVLFLNEAKKKEIAYIRDLKNQISAKKKLIKKEQEINALKSPRKIIQKLTKEVSEKEKEIEQLENQNENITNDISSLNKLIEKNDELKEKVNDLVKENKELTNMISSYEEKKQVLNKEVSDLNVNITQVKEENKKLLDGNLKEKTMLETIRQLEEKVNSLEKKNKKLKNMISSYEEKKQVLNKEISDLNVNITQLKEEDKKLLDGNLKEKTMLETCDKLEKKVGDLKEEKKNLKYHENTQSRNQQAIKEKVNNLAKQISHLKAENELLEKSKTSLESNQVILEDKVHRLNIATQENYDNTRRNELTESGRVEVTLQNFHELKNKNDQLEESLMMGKSREIKVFLGTVVSLLVLLTYFVVIYRKKMLKNKK